MTFPIFWEVAFRSSSSLAESTKALTTMVLSFGLLLGRILALWEGWSAATAGCERRYSKPKLVDILLSELPGTAKDPKNHDNSGTILVWKIGNCPLTSIFWWIQVPILLLVHKCSQSTYFNHIQSSQSTILFMVILVSLCCKGVATPSTTGAETSNFGRSCSMGSAWLSRTGGWKCAYRTYSNTVDGSEIRSKVEVAKAYLGWENWVSLGTIPGGAEFGAINSIWKSVLHCYTFLVVYIHLQIQQTPMKSQWISWLSNISINCTNIVAAIIQPTRIIKVPKTK